MFGQVLDKLDAWVGRSFLLGSLFPFLIFLAANAVMVQFMTPSLAEYAVAYFAGGVYGPVSATVTGLAAAAAFAYITDPFAGVMTKFLEGAYFPEPIAGWLAADQAEKARELEQAKQDSGRIRSQAHEYKRRLTVDLKTANDTGAAIGAILDAKLIENASARIKPLVARRDRQQFVTLDELEGAAKLLAEALRKNSADTATLAPDATEADRKNSAKLYELHLSAVQLVDYVHMKAVSEYSSAVNRQQTDFGSIELPTSFGNHTAALRNFFEARFYLDFEFFWPIVQLVLQNDQKSMDALTNARQKLDFCIRIFLYTVVFTAIWLLVSAFVAEHSWPLLAIGTGGFVLCALWLEIVHANYRSMSELIRSIVILKRFDLLKALHQRLPDTWADEKETWKQVGTQLLWGSTTDIKYQHPDK